MKKGKSRIWLWLLVICLMAIPFLIWYTGALKKTGTASGDKNIGSTPGKIAAKTASSGSVNKSAAEFSKAFTRVKKNPLNEDIQFALWLTATSEDPDSNNIVETSSAAITELADKYKKLVDSKGVHYTEVSEVLGMKLTSECWLKNGKFKKVDKSLEQVIVFDGKYYTKYNMTEKTGTHFKKDDPLVSSDIIIQSYGIFPNLARAAYQQKEDKKFGSFDCSVFFLDMEVMGMKGSTLWVDKNTGVLVKSVNGNEEDGIVTFIDMLETDGFGDDVFSVPADIKLTDN